jgi:hypothetical protein
VCRWRKVANDAPQLGCDAVQHRAPLLHPLGVIVELTGDGRMVETFGNPCIIETAMRRGVIIGTVEVRSGSSPLATYDEAVEKEEDYCADHSTNEARSFSRPIPPDRLTQIGRNERAYNSQNGRQNKPLRLSFVARHNELGNHSNDKANDNCPKNAHRIAPILNRHSAPTP